MYHSSPSPHLDDGSDPLSHYPDHQRYAPPPHSQAKKRSHDELVTAAVSPFTPMVTPASPNDSLHSDASSVSWGGSGGGGGVSATDPNATIASLAQLAFQGHLPSMMLMQAQLNSLMAQHFLPGQPVGPPFVPLSQQYHTADMPMSDDYMSLDEPVPAIPIPDPFSHAIDAITLESLPATLTARATSADSNDDSVTDAASVAPDTIATTTNSAPVSIAPLAPPLKIEDVFGADTKLEQFAQSTPVRPINHFQMLVFQSFCDGQTLSDIHRRYQCKPSTLLSHIIYCMESYSPSIHHPIFLYWHRFSIPTEITEKVFAVLDRNNGNTFRLDRIQRELNAGVSANSRILDEDIRVTMVRYKMEGAMKRNFRHFTSVDSSDAESHSAAFTPNHDASQADGSEASSGCDDAIPVTAGQLLHVLCLSGPLQPSCLAHSFKADWSQIEPIADKLIEEKLIWKRGKLYCPS